MAACVGLLSVGLMSCARGPRWNVLLVSIDTLRADHVGCYGHEAVDTPNMDRLAAEGVRFDRAYTPIPITLPSHTTMMTGLYPPAHGVRDNGIFHADPRLRTLAEILADEGYTTGAAVGAFPVTARFGLNQGFEFFDDEVAWQYEDLLGRRVIPKKSLFFDERPAARVNDAILPWLREHGHQRFFVWLHYFDPHQPLIPPAPYDDLYAADLYDGEIAYADECLGVLLGHLRELEVLDRTLIVVVADHGEGRGEHEESTHSLLAYNATLRVPLIIRPPGDSLGVVVSERTSTVDILPTVLDLLGVERPADIQGRSLVPLWSEAPGAAWEPRPFYAETLSGRLSYGWGELRALFEGPFKYIHGPRPELYDVQRDPHELKDLIDEKPERAEAMQQRLQSILDHIATGPESRPSAVDEETRNKLIALGYLSPGGGSDEPIREVLMDEGVPPQDRARDVSLYSMVKSALLEGRAAVARELATGLLDRNPTNPAYAGMLAAAELELGNADRVLEITESPDPNQPVQESFTTVRLQAGFLLWVRGRRAEGKEVVLALYRDRPSAESAYAMALFAADEGNLETQIKWLEAALAEDPEFAAARVDRAALMAGGGRLDAARRELRAALRDNPFDPRAHYNLGTLLIDENRIDEGLRHFRRAVQLEPRYLKARYAVAACCIGLGLTEEARREVEVLSQIAPDSPEAVQARELLEGK